MKHFLRSIFAHLLFAVTVNAQQHYFRHYQVENGLSNNTVFCNMQDKNGFMWFGTKDGLNRFDGYRFKTFHISNNDESSLTRDLISSLAIDKEGILWVGSQKGLYRFDARQERLVAFIDTLKDINDIYIDKQNQLWFTSGLTVCRYNFEKKRLRIFSPGRYFNATSICEAKDGSIWFSTNDGYLQQFDDSTETFRKFNVFAQSPPASSNHIEKILADTDGSIFIGTPSQGIKKFNPVSMEYQDVLTSNSDKTAVYVRDILQVSDDELWFATESGIFILDKNTGKFLNLKKKYLDPYSLSDNAIYALHKDSEGGIWAGTYFGGINYFPKQYFAFQKFFPDYTENSISGNAVREICEDGAGNIWIGTEDAGLNKLNPRTKQINHFEPTGEQTSIANSNIHGLLVVQDDLWVGTFEHGLDIIDINTGKVKKHYISGPGANDLKSNFIVSLLQTKSGEIYVGTSNGLFRYVRLNDHFASSENIPTGGFISCLMEDQAGTVWVGSHGRGIFYFNPVTGEKGHYENEPDNKNSLTSNIVNALYEDSDKNLWIATEGGGLCQLINDKKQFKRHTTKTGLPSNFIFKILEDNNKTLWITTSKGLVNMNVTRGTHKVYTKANGLLNDQFNYNSGYKDAAGKLYFGSVQGMITFKPDAFYQSKFVPPVYITEFQLPNKELQIIRDTSILKRSILLTNKITLPYDQSTFSVDFAAVSFTSPEMTEYSYTMEGLDKDWTYLKSNRKVYFTNLKPGTYIFKVKAGSNGSWNKQVKQLIVQVNPPFWATQWAYLVYIIVSSSLLYYLVRTYHRLQEDKKEKAIYQANIEFFTNIAHEIKTPLTLIKGPVENLSEMVNQVPAIREDVVTMERNTNRLVNLINQILDFRQTETKGFSLDFSAVNINEILQEAYLTFEPLAKKRKLLYTLNLPAADIQTMADAEALNKIFNNLFSNATKYAEKKVNIELIAPVKDEERLVIEISNDGYLIPKGMKEKIFEPFFRLKETIKQKGTGIGLALARSLVELHNGDIYLKDQEDGMNVFVVILPYYSDRQKKKNRTEELSPLAKTK
ncbi:MAG: histidine kinase [Chitinophagaceae bacterium]|nr:histidine kinase [Chitinophagaceae bacterium]